MKCISVRAPWWWWIVEGHKPIENRPAAWTYRGPLLIQASKWWDHDEVCRDWYAAKIMFIKAGHRHDEIKPPPFDELQAMCGFVVGRCDLTDVVRDADALTPPEAAWFQGPAGLYLANARRLAKPFRIRGMNGLFDVPTDSLGDLAAA